MGVFKWVGRELMAPVTNRKAAFLDLKAGAGSSARALRRGFRLRSRTEPPIFPGTTDQDVNAIYVRWQRLNNAQRKAAWREYNHVMQILMRKEAENSGAFWSLDLPASKRPAMYAQAHKRARKAMWIYGGLMALPIAAMPWQAGSFIYWLNLTAAAIILSPGVLRHLTIRAQVYHGGKVSVFKVFRPYPSTLPDAQALKGRADEGEDAATTTGLMRTGTFPLISWLYGIEKGGEQ